MNYDEAQLRLIQCNDKIVVGEAFAGSGKTQTAVGYCEYRPSERILYLCLNKANQQEASRRFPSNVTCLTTHALAFKAFGSAIKHRIVEDWKARHVAEELNVNIRLASAIRAVVNDFLHDEAAEIDVKHVMPVATRFDITSFETRKQMLELSRLLWSRMCDKGERSKMPHEAYLKQWALSDPQLDYEAIIVDEAQDSNAVTIMAIMAQVKARLVLIGDRHQSIYGFRGARNAMEHFASKGATVIKLAKTWRFGDRTAQLANAMLNIYKGERERIIGMGTDYEYQTGAPVAYISRTNAQLFALAAKHRGEATYWIGGSKNYRLDLVLDAYRLYSGQTSQIVDAMLARFTSWAAYTAEAEVSKDVEAKILIDAVNTYGDEIPALIDDIRFYEVDDPSKGQFVLGTGHKSKGFEFPYVKVCEDFRVYELICKNLKDSRRLSSSVIQEINLLYVVLTRAKHKVFLNNDSKAMFTAIKDGVAIKPDNYARR